MVGWRLVPGAVKTPIKQADAARLTSLAGSWGGLRERCQVADRRRRRAAKAARRHGIWLQRALGSGPSVDAGVALFPGQCWDMDSV